MFKHNNFNYDLVCKYSFPQSFCTWVKENAACLHIQIDRIDTHSCARTHFMTIKYQGVRWYRLIQIAVSSYHLENCVCYCLHIINFSLRIIILVIADIGSSDAIFKYQITVTLLSCSVCLTKQLVLSCNFLSGF